MSGPTHDLHKHLKAWRRHVGLTQEQVANKLDIAPSTLSGWENGGRTVDLDDLKVLADLYGVDPSLLLHAPPGSKKLQALSEVSTAFDQLSPEAMDDVVRIAMRLAGKPD